MWWVDCIPILNYGSERCLSLKVNLVGLELAICGLVMNIFDTRLKDIVYDSMNVFNVLTTDCADNRGKFSSKYCL